MLLRTAHRSSAAAAIPLIGQAVGAAKAGARGLRSVAAAAKAKASASALDMLKAAYSGLEDEVAAVVVGLPILFRKTQDRVTAGVRNVFRAARQGANDIAEALKRDILGEGGERAAGEAAEEAAEEGAQAGARQLDEAGGGARTGDEGASGASGSDEAAGAAVGQTIITTIGAITGVVGGVLDAASAFFGVADISAVLDKPEGRLEARNEDVTGQNVLDELNEGELEQVSQLSVPVVISGLGLAATVPLIIAVGPVSRKIAESIEVLLVKTGLSRTRLGAMLKRALANRRRARINAERQRRRRPVSMPDNRRRHILDGDATGGGHGPGRGVPGKSEFPDGMSDDEVIDLIVDVASDPNSSVTPGRCDQSLQNDPLAIRRN